MQRALSLPMRKYRFKFRHILSVLSSKCTEKRKSFKAPTYKHKKHTCANTHTHTHTHIQNIYPVRLNRSNLKINETHLDQHITGSTVCA